MRPLRLLAAALVLLAVFASPATAKRHVESSFCHPTGDYCEGVYRERGFRHLSFTTFSFRGGMRLCVTPPRGAATCRRFRLRSISHQLFEINVRWRRHFPYRGRGRYRVRFSQGPFRPPALSFRVR